MFTSTLSRLVRLKNTSKQRDPPPEEMIRGGLTTFINEVEVCEKRHLSENDSMHKERHSASTFWEIICSHDLPPENLKPEEEDCSYYFPAQKLFAHQQLEPRGQAGRNLRLVPVSKTG